ncbi:MAG: BPSS1780 family membrane protein [Casimicrobiaceae bacterium]
MAAEHDVAITHYPALRGALWLKEAFAMFSRARVPWLLLLLLYYAVMALVDVIPVIGQLAVPVLKPVFAVGFLAAAWSQERGNRPQLKQLFQGFRANLFALLSLGVVLLVGVTLAVLATALVDGGALLDVLSGKGAPEEGAAAGSMQAAMLFGAACALPVLLALWYAPALVVFHDCSAGRAIALSLRATLANWRPLAVYGLLVAFYGVVLPGFVAAIVALVVPATSALAVAVMVMMPYLFFLVATLHVSDYVSYRDIFHADEKPPATS